MSDYISRKALIDTIEKNCYPIRYNRCSEENGMTVTGIMQAINEQPTAFDLESVIEQLKELKTYKLNIADAMCELMNKDKLGNYVCLEDVIDILKSAANVTNGKNGGLIK